MSELLRRLQLAWTVIRIGESFLTERYKNERDLDYLSVLQQRNLAIQEREFAIRAMQSIANDSMLAIQELESALRQYRNDDQQLKGLIFPMKTNKDDLPN